MNTSQLIEALAADAPTPPVSMAKRVAIALAVGGVVSLAFFLSMVGFRPDIGQAMTTVRFQLKYLDAVALAIPAAVLCWRLARPDAKPGLLIAGLVAPLVLLAGAVAVELSVVPRDLWMAKMIGHQHAALPHVHPAAVDPAAGGADRRLARRRAGEPGSIGRAGGRGFGRAFRDDLRHQLHRRLAAVRRKLVSDCDARGDGRRRACGATLVKLVSSPFPSFAGEGDRLT